MAFNTLLAYPLPQVDFLKSVLVGKSLHDIPTPAAVIDRSKAQHNCKLMLEAVKDLGVSFRAHVKTHKCTELTRMQVGEECKDVRLIVSTIIEAEHLVPLLLDYKNKGATVNVLYGLPLGSSQVVRLAKIGEQLGQGSITAMIDHPSQLSEAAKFKSLTGFPISLFVKTDSGSHRAGINPSASAMAALVQAITALEDDGGVSLTGFYSHAGHSYSGNSPSEAMDMLRHEISTCQSAILHITPESRRGKQPLTISVGATPTAVSIQNLNAADPSSTPAARSLANLISQLAATTTPTRPSSSIEQTLELHAGVYPLLDLQQLATHARPLPTATDPASRSPSLSDNPIAITILTQIHSLYPAHTRASSRQAEALIAAGSLALGREPCKSYPGWGVVSPWNMKPAAPSSSSTAAELIVSQISQEHGILSSSGPSSSGDDADAVMDLAYGQRLRIYPNHACVACAMYAFYVVVDSKGSAAEEERDRDRVVDVWVRWRGW